MDPEFGAAQDGKLGGHPEIHLKVQALIDVLRALVYQMREEPGGSILILDLFSAKGLFQCFFFSDGEHVIDGDQSRKHHRGEQSRPMEEPSEHDQKEPGILGMSDVAIHTIRKRSDLMKRSKVKEI